MNFSDIQHTTVTMFPLKMLYYLYIEEENMEKGNGGVDEIEGEKEC